MQTNAKGLGGGKQDKEARLAKERKREEKELKRMAKAQGVKVGIIGGGVGTNALASGGPPATEEPKGFRKSGWATVGSTPVEDLGGSPSKKSTWAKVSSHSEVPDSSSSEAPPHRLPNHGFRTAGFETLETTSIGTMQKVDEGNHVFGCGSDLGAGSLLQSRWSSRSIEPQPPPPSVPPPPPSTLPPPSPPSLPPPPPSPPRYSRNDGMSSYREPSPRRHMPSERPPTPLSHHQGREGSWQSHLKYRGQRGYR